MLEQQRMTRLPVQIQQMTMLGITRYVSLVRCEGGFAMLI